MLAFGADVLVGDCRDPDAMYALVADMDALVHVAGVLLGAHIAPATSRVPRVIVVSTASVYSESRQEVELYRSGEEAIVSRNPAAAIVRPTMIYGSSRDRNVHRVIAFARKWHALPLPGDGGARIQPIHFDDLAHVLVALVQTDAYGFIDAGGPKPITIRAAAETIFAELRIRPRLIPIPLVVAGYTAALVDVFRRSRWAEKVWRLREDRTVDNHRLLQSTGAHLRTFEAGIAEQVSGSRETDGTT